MDVMPTPCVSNLSFFTFLLKMARSNSVLSWIKHNHVRREAFVTVYPREATYYPLWSSTRFHKYVTHDWTGADVILEEEEELFIKHSSAIPRRGIAFLLNASSASPSIMIHWYGLHSILAHAGVSCAPNLSEKNIAKHVPWNECQ
jgi:hypothetical protein